MGILREALGLSGGGVVALVGAGGKTSLMFRLAAELAGEGEAVLTTTTTRIRMPAPADSPCVVVCASIEEVGRRAAPALGARRHLTAAAGIADGGRKLAGFSAEGVAALFRTGLFRWIIVEADGAAGRPLKAPAAHEPVVPAVAQRVIGVVGLSVLGKPLDDVRVFRPERVAGISGVAPGGAVDAEAVAAVIAHPEGTFKSSPTGAERIVFLNQADRPEEIAAARRLSGLLRQGAGGGLARVVIGTLRPLVQVFAAAMPPTGDV